MKKISCLLIVLTTFFLTPSYGQEFLGKVQGRELAAREHAYFKTDKAVILEEQVKVDFEYSGEYGFRVNETVSRKVKLYDEAAKEALKLSVPYSVKGYSREEVTIEQAHIYRLVDGQVMKIKTEKGSLFDVSKGEWREKGITYTDAKSGDIIEYTYVKSTGYIDELPEWIIQGELPKEKTSYRVVVPEYFTYNILKKGRVELKETTQAQKISFRGLSGLMTRSSMDAVEKTYTAEKVSPYVVEAYVDNPINYIASLKLELSEVQFPGSAVEKVMQTQSEFYTNLLKSRSFGKELQSSKFLRKEINLAEYNGLSVEKKIEKLLRTVQSRVMWNQQYDVFTSHGVKTTFYKGIGNSADVNLLLVSMLRYVGLNANPVLLSTRSNGIKTVWQRNYYNHVIVSVEGEDQLYLLDGISKKSTLNVLPFDDLNGKGTVVYDNGKLAEIDLVPRFISKNTSRYQVSIGSNGLISGQIVEGYESYEALNFRNMYDGSAFRLGKWIESQYAGMTVTNARVYNHEELEQDVRVTYAFTRENGALFFNNKYFINPFQFYPLYSNPFKNEERESSIYLGYPVLDNYLMGIAIPEGYKVETLPSNYSVKDTRTGLEIQTKFEVKDNQVLCSLSVLKEKGVIPVEDYHRVKGIYEELLEQLKVQVVIVPL